MNIMMKPTEIVEMTVQKMKDRHILQQAMSSLSNYISWVVNFEEDQVESVKRMAEYTKVYRKLDDDLTRIDQDIAELVNSMTDEERTQGYKLLAEAKKKW